MTEGAAPHGTGPSGSSGLLSITSATGVTATSVDVVFDKDLLSTDGLLLANSYTFDNGLVCVGVSRKAALNELRLYTTIQTSGQAYELAVDTSAVCGASSEVLFDNTADFDGVSAATTYSVSSLAASTHCAGRRIDLSWTNPSSPTPIWTKIVRRQKNWVFDLDDPHEVVYDGDAISSFADTGVGHPVVALTVAAAAGDATLYVTDSSEFSIGDKLRLERLYGATQYEVVEVASVAAGEIGLTAPTEYGYDVAQGSCRVGRHLPLIEQTYYYYTVLVSDVEAPPDQFYSFTDANRVMGLSIAVMDSKEDFFWANTPEYHRARDEADGNGFLDKWYDVMGCWLNIMRGKALALKHLGDDDQAPYNTLSAKNISLGMEPEGFSYDFEIPRRSVLALISVYKRRGACEGLVRAVRMFTKWDAVCAEFGLGGCASGPSSARTWDGVSLTDRGQGLVAVVVTANRLITDTTKSFAVDDWKDGTLVGSIGDVCCVQSNDATAITLKSPTQTHTSTAALTAGDTVVSLDSTLGLLPGITLQLESPADAAISEIVEVLSVVAGTSITTKSPIENSYPEDSIVSIGKSLVRREWFGTGTWATVSGTTRELTCANAGWTQTQWVGYKVLSSDNVLLDVVSNEGDTIRVDAVILPADGDFAVALDFQVGASFALREATAGYRIHSGGPSVFFDPLLDLETRGTLYDPFNRLWMGRGSPVLGAWGSGDVGVIVTSEVAVHLGKATTVVGATLALDPNQPAPTLNEWAGYFLNPNQNQTQLFRVLSNTTTHVTVTGAVDGLVVVGQVYYILKSRDANRFRQLVRRLGPPTKEFAHEDINVRVLLA